MLDNARSGHNGCGRKCEERIQQHLGRGDTEQLYPRDRSCFEHRGLRGFASALHQARNRLAYRRLRDLWKHSHLPLPGVDRLPRCPPTTIQAHLENLRPLGDLSADCRNVHAIPARQFAGRVGMVAARYRVGMRHGRDHLQSLVR